MLLPVLAGVKKHAKIVQAQTEMQGIVTAIQGYDSAYGRFPVSGAAQAAAGNGANNPRNPNGDFTYGGIYQTPGGNAWPNPISINYSPSNSEVIAILMDRTNYPGGGPTINMNHVKNPQQQVFLNAKAAINNSSPGLGTDLVYRDPWGNPYVISMDLNYDGMCQDAFYCQKKVSWQNGSSTAGLNGLVSAGNQAFPDDYKYHGTVMVWSAGPDGKIDPGSPANQGVNKDNVLSWK